MSASLPNGSVVSIASTYGTGGTVSAITNAVQGVATLSASHGVIAADVFEIVSGWEFLSNRIVRALSVATNDVTMELIDTSSTTIYPAGQGAGTFREITAWTTVGQILESTSDGGEQQFNEFQYLSGKTQQRLATVKSAQGVTFRIADDPTALSAAYTLLRAADLDGVQRAVRVVLPSGKILYYNATISFNDNPSLTVNEVMAVTMRLSFTGILTRY